MKIALSCACFMAILMAFARGAYAECIDYTAIETDHTLSLDLNPSVQSWMKVDPPRTQEPFNDEIPIDNLLSLGADGSVAFLLDVSRDYVYFIHNEQRPTSVPATPVPEPGTMMLVGFGIMGASIFFRTPVRR